MAADWDNRLKACERQLRQGRVQTALAELQRLVRDHPRDLPLLNRVGDLLARHGQQQEAIGYYEKIAEQFTQKGFFPKAIAIHKKILKANPRSTSTLLQLGDLYLTQQLAGEARSHLLRAAELFLEEGEFASARKAYEKLAASEPDDPRHRLRIAETRAAEGGTETAGEEMLSIGDSLLTAGRLGDAGKVFQRASELMPGRFEPILGRAFSLAATNQHEEATRVLDEAIGARADCAAELRPSLAVLYDFAGKQKKADKAAREAGSSKMTDATFERVIRYSLAQGRAPMAWKRLDPVLASWSGTERAVALLGKLADLEEDGHLPALERLHEILRESGDRTGAVKALERLVQGYQARSMDREASTLLEQLREFSPKSTVARSSGGKATTAEPAATDDVAGKETEKVVEIESEEEASQDVEATETPSAAGGWLQQAETPAVPLNPADEEFVSGHLTEAEVLQKYGLASEALDRLRTVTARFPGLVVAQERLAALARAQGDRPAERDTLVQLALARRAAGDTDAARDAAEQAAEMGGLPRTVRETLERLALLEATSAAIPTGVESEEPSADETEAIAADRETAARTASERPQEPGVATGAADREETEEETEVEIVFDDEPVEKTERVSSVVTARVPPPDVVEEIEFYTQQGMLPEARQRLEALRTLGYSGDEIDALARAIEAASPEEEKVTPEPVAAEAGERSTGIRLDDEELGEIAAALEAELGEEPQVAPAISARPGEESLEEVFAVFKRHVEKEVDGEDFQTHYDLGIAYKEMGLLDDALGEFEIATRSPEIHREACSMLALCQKELGNMAEAARWFEKAIEEPGVSDEDLQGLRYDLADVLLQQGDAEGALAQLRHVLEVDPGYRDVQARVSELQTRLGS